MFFSSEITYKTHVRDNVTGYSGKVTAICHYYHKRPDSVLVEGIDTTGRPIEWWTDVERIEILGEE